MSSPNPVQDEVGRHPPAGIDIDISVESGGWPDETALRGLVEEGAAATFEHLGIDTGSGSELSLLFVDDERMRSLNASWRGKDKPTNVLSFPASNPARGATSLPPMLGDIVFAFETVEREAALEGKTFNHHLSHLLVHGLLHLLGYDHETEHEAEEMESLERQILQRLAIDDPYA